MKKYKLTTIKDIFDNVPVDRLGVLFDEIQVLMEQCAFIRGGDGVSAVVFPETITWVDDGKGEVTINAHELNTGEHLLSMKTRVGVGIND